MASKKSADPNKLRQAKMIREKKMERIGNYREDGKRYKLRSLKTLDESSIRLAQKVVIEVDDPIVKMLFPSPTWPPALPPNATIVRMENLSFGYQNSDSNKDKDKLVLNDITLNIARGSKIALVGPNGSGKSSLLKLIAGDHNRNETICKGNLWMQPNLRIGYVSQYTVEQLETFAHQTVVEYTEDIVQSGRASARIAAGNVRQYLGAFGLGGPHALRRIGQLSGGERMRLSFATVLADNPGLLLLDEANNHVSMETLEAMATAWRAFDGAVLMVSHNQAFLSGFCQELWVLDAQGRLAINPSAESGNFDAMFTEYRHRTLDSNVSSSGTALRDRQRQKTLMAKRAAAQRQGTRQTAALL
jgi:ATP-binding cassette, subfamily F, member 3